ncbi:HEPN domain-containing protein [Pelagerythrobacter marinus]|uniref:HEPN domain-containing protein n=1 Tax=Pelagerythrobacter marinus TaxID=538382 RepID=UPI0020373F19|nr:HEPN domain-containing protein [Pelagerythrobacter marinus]USA39754.1 HEPN domain-containing protein [Pelagerythrobacter marinus]WPZ06115.1 HEPN domain-containing protein [Pelagerythrobacter marinus]
MADLVLTFVDEVIEVRKEKHGGRRGAPYVRDDGSREGQALNRAAIALLSATLQTFCEDVFFETSRAVLNMTDQQLEDYRSLYDRWGNPGSGNIKTHFRRLGIPDVIDGLSWQKSSSETIKRKLDDLNQLRNGIAHGREQLVIRGSNVSLSLAIVINYRNFVDQFGRRFQAHVNLKAGVP